MEAAFTIIKTVRHQSLRIGFKYEVLSLDRVLSLKAGFIAFSKHLTYLYSVKIVWVVRIRVPTAGVLPVRCHI
jgi:hypothetical protein